MVVSWAVGLVSDGVKFEFQACDISGHGKYWQGADKTNGKQQANNPSSESSDECSQLLQAPNPEP